MWIDEDAERLEAPGNLPGSRAKQLGCRRSESSAPGCLLPARGLRSAETSVSLIIVELVREYHRAGTDLLISGRSFRCR